MKTHIHISLSLKGALKNWKKSEWVRVLKDDSGRWLSPEETKDQFLEWLSEGKEKVPFARFDECPEFDYKKGCPGHPISESSTPPSETI